MSYTYMCKYTYLLVAMWLYKALSLTWLHEWSQPYKRVRSLQWVELQAVKQLQFDGCKLTVAKLRHFSLLINVRLKACVGPKGLSSRMQLNNCWYLTCRLGQYVVETTVGQNQTNCTSSLQKMLTCGLLFNVSWATADGATWVAIDVLLTQLVLILFADPSISVSSSLCSSFSLLVFACSANQFTRKVLSVENLGGFCHAVFNPFPKRCWATEALNSLHPIGYFELMFISHGKDLLQVFRREMQEHFCSSILQWLPHKPTELVFHVRHVDWKIEWPYVSSLPSKGCQRITQGLADP